MLHSINSLRDFWIHASDGDLGAVSEFFVDERDWSIPWFTIDTGNWLPGKKVVLPTSAISRDDWDNRYLHVARRRDEILHSPAAAGATSLAGHVAGAVGHLHMPHVLPSLEREFDAPGAPSTPDADADADIDFAPPQPAAPEARLHPVRDLEKLQAMATDGLIGRVCDLVCDDASWRVRYAVVDESAIAPGKLAPIAPHWIERIDWTGGKMHVDLPRDIVRTSPQFHDWIDAEYEGRLAEHYNRRA